MDWLGYVVTLAVAIIGTGGWVSYLRVRAQNRVDTSLARKADADASKSLAEADTARVNAYAALWEKVNSISAENDRKLEAAEVFYQEGINAVRAELQADIEDKDIRLKANEISIKRLDLDVIALKQKLSEWRAYAMGLYDMLVKLKETPPPPPATGPLG